MTDRACMVASALRVGTGTFVTASTLHSPELLAATVSNCHKTQKCAKSCLKLILISGAATLKFYGNNSMSLRYERGATNEADDLTLRFRTREQVLMAEASYLAPFA